MKGLVILVLGYNKKKDLQEIFDENWKINHNPNFKNNKVMFDKPKNILVNQNNFKNNNKFKNSNNLLGGYKKNG